MTPYEIPLSAEPQTFNIQLSGVERKLRFYWNKWSECWMLDMMTNLGAPLLLGIPVITGADLLGQYAYMELGGSIVVQTDFDLDAVPTFDNLGTLGRVYFIVE